MIKNVSYRGWLVVFVSIEDAVAQTCFGTKDYIMTPSVDKPGPA